MLSSEGTAHPVSFAGCEASHVNSKLIYLILKKDNTEGSFQSPLLQRMIIVNRLSLASSS